MFISYQADGFCTHLSKTVLVRDNPKTRIEENIFNQINLIFFVNNLFSKPTTHIDFNAL